MAHVAITVEGGLFSADLLERLGSRPEEVPGQRPADFGFDGTRLSEEIQATFSDVQRQWQTFEGRSARQQGSATSLTRDLWMLPVLRLLGYDVGYRRAALHAGGGSFPISHLAGEKEGAPPVHIVAHDQELDRRGDARQSPHALVQDYLNRSDTLWGVVTNGRKLRLLRDSKRFAKPTYLEFDLGAMVAGNLYSEFVTLFRLAHRARLPNGTADAHECWLERYYQKGIEEGGRVRERLSEGVFQALLALGTGFLAHPDSERLREQFRTHGIEEGEYYRQLLRLVYRLLFLMVAEERRLLLVPDHENAHRQRIYTDWYSITRLRQLAERRFTGDHHSDLFEGLKQTFLLFRDEKHASMLGLTALDGELFGPLACRDLEVAGCRNEDLLGALFHVSTFEDAPEGRGRARRRGVRRRVNYAGLDVEELGSVYEGLLEYHPQVDRERWSFDLVAGSERKQTGSYYTPHTLVMELIDSALVPVMEERLANAKTPEEKERALLDLKVVDPAAGSGHFLLAAARRIGKELARVRTGEPEPAPEAQRAAIRDVVRHCLYAVDKNPLAVDLCKVALWIEGHNTGRPLSFLDHHVKLGDSLIGVFDLEVLKKGIPDDAYKPLTGDDKDVARHLERRNRQERTGQETLGFLGSEDLATAEADIGRAARELDTLEDDSPAAMHEKERRYSHFRELHADFRRLRQACDLWAAAFFAKPEKPRAGEPERIPPTDHVLRAVRNQPGTQGVMKTALELAQDHRFFHWPLEFPTVLGESGSGEQRGFDVVLGNPPYIRPHNLPPSTKNFLWANFTTFVAKADQYTAFVERAIQVLGFSGRLGVVLSNSWLRLDSFEVFRDFLLNQTNIVHIMELQFHAFVGVSVYTSLLAAEKSTGSGDAISIGHVTSFAFGLKTGDDKRFLTRVDDHPLARPLLRGENVHRYRIEPQDEYVIYDPDAMRAHRKTARPGTPDRFERPKILVRDTGGRFECAYDDQEFYCKDLLIVHDKVRDRDLLRALTAVLNSKIMRFYYETSFPTLHVQRDEVASLPIARALVKARDLVERLSELVEAIQTGANIEVEETEEEVEAGVYQLYNLDVNLQVEIELWSRQGVRAFSAEAGDGAVAPVQAEDVKAVTRRMIDLQGKLLTARAELKEAQDSLSTLVARSDREALPTLFVEGETDRLIVEGAWRALFPDEPLPVSVLPAGGTTQMKSLATPGKAMRELLGERLVLALADNDAEGRELWNEGNLHKGGVWKPQTNGVHWCLLKPSDEFQAIMEHFQIPRTHWPFTIENAFAAELRLEAAGAYAVSDKVQSDLIRDPEVAQKVFAGLRGLDESDDAYLYLMAPTPEAKDAFAAWVTRPERLTRENYASFEVVLSRLKDLLARHQADEGQSPQQRRLA